MWNLGGKIFFKMTKSLIITYMRGCKEAGIKLHPARFLRGFPEFLIKFLADENDIVLDPFAG